MNIATVFSGIGSFEQSLIKQNINHKIIFACDIDKYVKQSYFENYKNIGKWFDDIKNINKNIINEKIDIFVGGSPCQSFSIAGKRLGFEDIRGTLFFEYARCIKEFQPKVFIYENVKGLTNHDGGKTFETVMNTFEELGYKCFKQILNSKDYGIPQNRQRIFIIGFKDNNIHFKFPEKQELKLKVKDLLEENVDDKYFLSEKMVKYILNTDYKGFDKHTIDTDIAKTLLATMTKMHRASIDNYVTDFKIGQFRRTYMRDSKSGLCPTLTANMGTGGNNVPIINKPIRKLTPRECLRLMGFPDTFKQVVSDSQIYKQAGNSIVVNVLEELLKEIIISLNN